MSATTTIQTTRTFTGSRHTGYVVTADDLTVATVTESRLRNYGGYYIRLYTSPDEHTITRTNSILDARDMAERHALTF